MKYVPYLVIDPQTHPLIPPVCCCVHRGTAQARRIQATSSASWWRSELNAARHVGFVTLSGWTTASSCQPPWRQPPIEVRERCMHTYTENVLFLLFSVRSHSCLWSAQLA